jgi:2'-5' RNA ligase
MPSDHDTARLFVTLWPDDAVRAELRAYRKQWQWPRTASPMHGDKLHLTLHFLGSVPRAVIPAIERTLDIPFTPFDLTFGHAEVWRHGSAVLEPLTTPHALLDLHARLGRALQNISVALEERPFRPHVTMGRQATGALPPQRTPRIDWPVTGFALIESKPDHGGYVVLRHYP